MRTVRGGGTSACLAFLFSWCCYLWDGGTFVRPETRHRREKGWKENVFGMGLKDSRWSEQHEQS